MHFEVSTLEPQIRQILSAPGTDLKTISAKSVRKQLLEIGPGLTAEFLRENKKDVDGVIASVFDEVSTTATAGRVEGREDHHTPRERETSEEMDVDEGMGQDTEEDDAVATLPPPRVKKSIKSERELSDAELARQLSSEINSRTRRNAGGKTRGSMNGSTKKAARKLKSAAIVDTDDDDNDDDDSTMESGKKKAKPKKKAGGGSAKGGFAKEYVLRYVLPLRSFPPLIFFYASK
jgi:upstream activation factor subunit UAF30